MRTQIFIRKGKAIVVPDGLRCQGPRLKQPAKLCNKLLAKKNELGQVCGAFKCERCGQEITAELQCTL